MSTHRLHGLLISHADSSFCSIAYAGNMMDVMVLVATESSGIRAVVESPALLQRLIDAAGPAAPPVRLPLPVDPTLRAVPVAPLTQTTLGKFANKIQALRSRPQDARRLIRSTFPTAVNLALGKAMEKPDVWRQIDQLLSVEEGRLWKATAKQAASQDLLLLPNQDGRGPVRYESRYGLLLFYLQERTAYLFPKQSWRRPSWLTVPLARSNLSSTGSLLDIGGWELVVPAPSTLTLKFISEGERFPSLNHQLGIPSCQDEYVYPEFKVEAVGSTRTEHRAFCGLFELCPDPKGGKPYTTYVRARDDSRALFLLLKQNILGQTREGDSFVFTHHPEYDPLSRQRVDLAHCDPSLRPDLTLPTSENLVEVTIAHQPICLPTLRLVTTSIDPVEMIESAQELSEKPLTVARFTVKQAVKRPGLISLRSDGRQAMQEVEHLWTPQARPKNKAGEDGVETTLSMHDTSEVSCRSDLLQRALVLSQLISLVLSTSARSRTLTGETRSCGFVGNGSDGWCAIRSHSRISATRNFQNGPVVLERPSRCSLTKTARIEARSSRGSPWPSSVLVCESRRAGRKSGWTATSRSRRPSLRARRSRPTSSTSSYGCELSVRFDREEGSCSSQRDTSTPCFPLSRCSDHPRPAQDQLQVPLQQTPIGDPPRRRSSPPTPPSSLSPLGSIDTCCRVNCSV